MAWVSEWMGPLYTESYPADGGFPGFFIVIGLGFLAGGFMAGWIMILLVHPILAWVASKTKNERDDQLIDAIKFPLEKTFQLVGVTLAAYWWSWGAHEGKLDAVLYSTIVQFAFIAAWLILGAFMLKVCDFLAGLLEDWTKTTENAIDDQLVDPVRRIMRAAVMIFIGIMVINSIGWDVGAILAGLGLGGIAFALAGQEIIKNMFGSVTVFADRPFKVGDTIAVGDVKGTVESIGFRSSRIRTWDQTEVTLPNKYFTDSKVENLSRRKVRRFTANFGCTYDTTREQMVELVNGIRVLLANIEIVDKDSITVYFTEFGDNSINLLVRASMTELNYARYMATVQDLNLAIWSLYDDLGIGMAFPTRTIDLSPSTVEALAGMGKGRAAASKKKTTKAASSKKAAKKKSSKAAGEKVAAKAEGAAPSAQDRTTSDLDLTD